MIMDNLMLKFPHLFEQTFRKLNKKGLFKAREVGRSWQYFVNERNYPWLCIVNIPTTLQSRNRYLHLAAETGQIDAFKIALNEEENKNIKNIHRATPFHIACKNGRFNIAKLLLENSVIDQNQKSKSNLYLWLNTDLNSKDDTGRTAFHLVCRWGYIKVVKMFLANFATLSIDLKAKDNEGRTAFHVACEWGQVDVVKILMENPVHWNVDLKAKDNMGRTAVHLVQDHVNVFRMLMEKSFTCTCIKSLACNSCFDFNAKDIKGQTAFHKACRDGHVNVANMIMENSATLSIDLNAKDSRGQTAFHKACKWGQVDVVKMFMDNLVSSRIDLNAEKNVGQTSFHRACEWVHSNVAKIFMDNSTSLSIDLNAKDNLGATAPQLAFQWGHLIVANMITHCLDLDLNGLLTRRNF